jgi:hypothetical protein
MEWSYERVRWMMMGIMMGLKLGFKHIHPNQDSDLNLECIEQLVNGLRLQERSATMSSSPNMQTSDPLSLSLICCAYVSCYTLIMLGQCPSDGKLATFETPEN